MGFGSQRVHAGFSLTQGTFAIIPHFNAATVIGCTHVLLQAGVLSTAILSNAWTHAGRSFLEWCVAGKVSDQWLMRAGSTG
jgi:hypothetical protein